MANYSILLAINLDRLMKEFGLNQTTLAEKTGVKQPVISRILNRKMENAELMTLEPLVAPFKKTVGWLLTDHSTTPQKEAGNAELLAAMAKLQARVDQLESGTKTQASDASAPDLTTIEGGAIADRKWLIEFIRTAPDDEIRVLRTTLEPRTSLQDKKTGTSESS